MKNETISVKNVTPLIGAEITGIDFTKPLSDELYNLLNKTLADRQVLFFRDQDELSPDHQIDLGKRFGALHVHPAAPAHVKHDDIFVIHTHKDSKIANGNDWHTDVSCDTEPPLGTILQMHTLPSCGGDTLFASMYAAYDGLSDVMQSFLSGLTAMHESEHIYRGRYEDRGVDDTGRVFPKAEHPVIRTHPVSGRQALYVNQAFTTCIKGLAREESDALLSFLFRHMERPEYQVRFQWTKNAIAFWDNRCVQHYAMWDYWPEERKGHRVTIKGERPFYRADKEEPAVASAQ